MLQYKVACNKADLNITRTEKFNDCVEHGPVAQVLDLSLCAFSFGGYVLLAFVPLERLSNIKEQEKTGNHVQSH